MNSTTGIALCKLLVHNNVSYCYERLSHTKIGEKEAKNF